MLNEGRTVGDHMQLVRLRQVTAQLLSPRDQGTLFRHDGKEIPPRLFGIQRKSKMLGQTGKTHGIEVFPVKLSTLNLFPDGRIDAVVNRLYCFIHRNIPGGKSFGQRHPLGGIKIQQSIVGIKEQPLVSHHISSFLRLRSLRWD